MLLVAKTIIDAVLKFSNDLGFLPEEGDVKTGEILGNIPQTFVHSSFIRVVLDYRNAISRNSNNTDRQADAIREFSALK
jgi:GH15 family glucan-1,4-alpha-glucosidase